LVLAAAVNMDAKVRSCAPRAWDALAVLRQDQPIRLCVPMPMPGACSSSARGAQAWPSAPILPNAAGAKSRFPKAFLITPMLPLDDWRGFAPPNHPTRALPWTRQRPKGLCKPRPGALRPWQNGCRSPPLRTKRAMAIPALHSCPAPKVCGPGTPSTWRGGSEGRRPSDLLPRKQLGNQEGPSAFGGVRSGEGQSPSPGVPPPMQCEPAHCPEPPKAGQHPAFSRQS